MLHIVNGDSVADKLRQGIVEGEILVWREVYPHGPVFLEPSTAGNRMLRAQYLEQTMGIPCSEYIETCEKQEKVLAGFHNYDEVVLWFEHDLFDQTMLSYLLYWFSGQQLSKTKLSMLCIGEYPGIEPFRGLGQLSVEQMKTLPDTRKSVGAAELDLGRAFWEAFTSQDPVLLQRLLSKDTSALPYALDAFQFHLLRLPSTSNGLGIVEQTTLEVVHAGVNAPYELFDGVGNRLHIFGMGDLQYWHILLKMSQAPHPLLHIYGLDSFPAYNESPASFRNCEIALTALGKSIMDGQEDWIAKQGIEEWYGGVHLHGYAPRWRYNSDRQMIQDTDAEAGYQQES